MPNSRKQRYREKKRRQREKKRRAQIPVNDGMRYFKDVGYCRESEVPSPEVKSEFLQKIADIFPDLDLGEQLKVDKSACPAPLDLETIEFQRRINNVGWGNRK